MTLPRVPATAVVAVGGNALTDVGEAGTWAEIEANAAQMARSLAPLVRSGWRVAVVHGNGPQVGNLALQHEALESSVPAQPLHQLCAMTQGQLGGVLVRAIDGVCGAGTAACVVTHVTVDPHDAAFAHPTKPIGPFLTRERAEELVSERGWHVVEDSGRGYRRVVPSPRPDRIVEIRAVSSLLQSGHVVLAGGGGGVAVASSGDGAMRGIDAVIDKDLTAAVLAADIGATELYLLTGVDAVRLDFGTPDERPVGRITAEEAERHLAEGQFPPGSMGPKITAALQFVRNGGQRAIITSASLMGAAVSGRPGVGTSIVSGRLSVGSAT